MQQNQLENFVLFVAILENTNVSSVEFHIVESNAKTLMKKRAASNGTFDFRNIFLHRNTDKSQI